jgi:hypothetical protein
MNQIENMMESEEAAEEEEERMKTKFFDMSLF